jgi:hypothetical protein
MGFTSAHVNYNDDAIVIVFRFGFYFNHIFGFNGWDCPLVVIPGLIVLKPLWSRPFRLCLSANLLLPFGDLGMDCPIPLLFLWEKLRYFPYA